jgi:hypothetical protein
VAVDVNIARAQPEDTSAGAAGLEDALFGAMRQRV